MSGVTVENERSLEHLCSVQTHYAPAITDQTTSVMTGEQRAARMLEIAADTAILIITGYSRMLDTETSPCVRIAALVRKSSDENKFLEAVADPRSRPER